MQGLSDLALEAQEKKKQSEEREGPKDEGDAPAARPPMAVARVADPRVDRHVHPGRERCDDESDDPVRGFEVVELQRNDRRRDRFHHLEAKVAPEQPSEKCNEPHLAVGQCAHRVTAGG